jgi:hypothetical protein
MLVGIDKRDWLHGHLERTRGWVLSGGDVERL